MQGGTKQTPLDKRKWMVIRKLAQMECASMEDNEIDKCLRGCVASRRLTAIAKDMVESGELTMRIIREFE